MQYRRRPALTEAIQWFRNGDHPRDRSIPIDTPNGNKLSEGEVVKFFKATHIPGGRFCPECGNIMQKHGIIPDLTNGHDDQIVHPGDYILTDPHGRYYTLRPEVFEAQYEPYEVVPHPPPEKPS